MADDAVLHVSTIADTSGIKAVGDSAAELGPKLSSASSEFEKLEHNVEKSQHSMMEARHATMMIAEDFGVRMPRAVAGFIASIGPIGAALEMAFPVLAGLALIEVIEKVIEKFEAYDNALRKSAAETADLTIKDHDRSEQIEVTNLKLEDQIGKIEDRPTINKLSEALLESKIKADELASALSSDFAKFDTEITKSVGFVENLKQAFTTARGAAEFLTSLTTPSKSTTLTIPGAESIAAAGKDQEEALKKVQEAMEGVSELRLKMSETKTEAEQKKAIEELRNAYLHLKTEAHSALDAVNVDSPKNVELIGALKNTVVQANAGMIDMNEQAKNLGLTMKAAGLDQAGINAERLVKDSKAALDQRLADIQAEKAAAHAAFENGTADRASWLAAEKRAVSEAAAANEEYHTQVFNAYQDAGQLEKADAEAKALNVLQTKNLAKESEELSAAQDKHREIATKLNKEFDKFQFEQVVKNWKEMSKAVDELAVSEKVLITAQGDLNKAATAEGFEERISQIHFEASTRVLTKQQEADQLKAVYEEEKTQAINSINAEIEAQKKIVDSAKEGIAERAATYGEGSAEQVAAQAAYNKDLAAYDQLLAKKLSLERNFDNQIAAAQREAQSEQLAAENAFISQSESAFNNFATTIATTVGVVNGRISEWKFIEQQFSQMVFKMEKDFLAAVLKMVEDSALFKAVENKFRDVLGGLFSHIPGLGSLGGAASGAAGGAAGAATTTANTAAMTANTTAVTAASTAETAATTAHVTAGTAATTLAASMAAAGVAAGSLTAALTAASIAATAESAAEVAETAAVASDTAAIVAHAITTAALSFDQGGVVPSTGLIMAHEGERVLSVDERKAYEGAIMSGVGASRKGATNTNVNLHYHSGDISALDSSGVAGVLNQNRDHVTKMFGEAIRRGGINPRSFIR